MIWYLTFIYLVLFTLNQLAHVFLVIDRTNSQKNNNVVVTLHILAFDFLNVSHSNRHSKCGCAPLVELEWKRQVMSSKKRIVSVIHCIKSIER